MENPASPPASPPAIVVDVVVDVDVVVVEQVGIVVVVVVEVEVVVQPEPVQVVVVVVVGGGVCDGHPTSPGAQGTLMAPMADRLRSELPPWKSSLTYSEAVTFTALQGGYRYGVAEEQ